MKILVTGGAGYIGSVLVPVLLTHGHEVIVLDNFRYRQYTALANCCRQDNLSIIKGDVRDTGQLELLCSKVNCIIPLAALVGAPICELYPTEATDVNYGQLERIIEYSADKFIIYPNTNSGYGKSSKICTEEDPLKPVSLYGHTKCEVETILEERHDCYVVLRLATVFGASPRMRTDLMVNDFVLRAYHTHHLSIYEPNARRNFIHILDVARVFLQLVNMYDMGQYPIDRVYNLGHDESNMTKIGLCKLIKEYLPGLEWSIHPGADPDGRDYIVSNERIKTIGAAPALHVRDGIRELVNLYECFPIYPWGNV